jgi:DNA invertase Pin-like site-specific DNA recombinase
MTATATARPPAKQQTPIAFSYVRFSTRKQAQGDSQRRQTEMAAAYCQRRGWTLSGQTFEDLGVSAFRGKNALIGNLGEFLKAVQSGAVPPESVLIVESLDRISRQGIDEGYDLIKRILKAGVRLVTLAPEREFDVSATKSLSKGALEILLILERAAEESERRSERIAAAWAGKRKKAREDRSTIVAGSLPAWIEKRDGKLRLIPERAKAIRRIFALAVAGYGRNRIVQALKDEQVPPFNGEDWATSSVGFILSDRRALGVYQPRKAGRLAAGEAILDYYPGAVTEQEWLAARAGTVTRRRAPAKTQRPWSEEEDNLVRRLAVSTAARRTGRSRSAIYQRRCALGLTAAQHRTKDRNFINVFTGLVRNAREPHDNYVVVTRNDCDGPRKALLNRAHAEGKAPCWLFRLEPFEKGVLGALRELDPRDVLPPNGENTSPDEAAQLQTELDGVEAELAEATAFMEANGFSPTIGKRIAALEARKKEWGAKLLDAKAARACPAEQAWREYGSLLDVLDKAPDKADARLRLRAALRRIVEGIWMLVVPRGIDRLAAVQVWFAGGERHRDYLIFHRPAKSNGKKRVEGAWWARSLADAAPGGLDLRKRDHARRLEKALAAVDLQASDSGE